jgi:hypothetical protein
MRVWLGRARRMTLSDSVTAVDVLRLAIWIEIALRVMPFSRLLQRVGCSRSPSATVTDFRRLVRFVAVAYQILPLPATCLRQSLVLHALLTRRGAPSRFRLGVARNRTSLEAHAWVECDGMTNDAGSRFAELTAPAKEFADVVNEELGFLHRGEVASAGHVRQLL